MVGLGGLKHLSTNEKSEPTGFSNLPRSSKNKKRETYGNMLIIPDLERSVKANHKLTGGNCPKRFLSIGGPKWLRVCRILETPHLAHCEWRWGWPHLRCVLCDLCGRRENPQKLSKAPSWTTSMNIMNILNIQISFSPTQPSGQAFWVSKVT